MKSDTCFAVCGLMAMVASLGAPLAASWGGVDEQLLADTYVRAGADLCHVQFSAASNGKQLALGLVSAETAASAGVPEVIWQGKNLITPDGSYGLAHGRDSSGDAVFAMTAGGSSRKHIVYWWPTDAEYDGSRIAAQFEGTRLDWPEILAEGAFALSASRRVRLSSGADIDRNGPITMWDAFDPQIFRWAGKAYLIGGSRAWTMDENPWLRGADLPDDWACAEEHVTWVIAIEDQLAVLTTEDGEVQRPIIMEQPFSGHAIAPGVSPRVAVAGNEVLLAVREPADLDELHGAAPVSVYRSSDLVNWVVDDQLSGVVRARENYSFAMVGSEMVIATTNSANEAALVVWRSDEGLETWQLDGSVSSQARRVRSHDCRVWAVPAEGGSTGCEIVFEDPGGARQVMHL